MQSGLHKWGNNKNHINLTKKTSLDKFNICVHVCKIQKSWLWTFPTRTCKDNQYSVCKISVSPQLSWKWQFNDIVMMQQNRFVIKITKKSVMFNNIFYFVISESCDWGVLYTHNMWLLILVFIFYFVTVSNLLILIKQKYLPWPTIHDPQPPLFPHDLPRKTTITTVMVTGSAIQYGRNFTCDQPSWQSFLHQLVLPPMLALSFVARGEEAVI